MPCPLGEAEEAPALPAAPQWHLVVLGEGKEWSEDSPRAPRSERGSWGVNKKQSLEQVGMGWDGVNEG